MKENWSLAPGQVTLYERDGFLFPVPVFSPNEVATWATEILAIAERGIPEHPVPWNQKMYLLLPTLDNLMCDPRLTSHVASILGDDLLVLSADVFLKPAHSTGRITWHQDVNYWQLEPVDVVLTAWVALTPATRRNGCMRYAIGRHRSRLDHVERPSDDNILSRGQEIAVAIDEDEAVDVVLRAGDASFHHGLTPHASGPNTTDQPRVGFGISYAPTSVNQIGGPPLSARLVRGNDRYGHFELETGPDEALSPNALSKHVKALSVHRETNFSTA